MPELIVNSMVEIVFSKFVIYLAPVFFVFMVILFSDSLIHLLYSIFSDRKNRW